MHLCFGYRCVARGLNKVATTTTITTTTIITTTTTNYYDQKAGARPERVILALEIRYFVRDMLKFGAMR